MPVNPSVKSLLHPNKTNVVGSCKRNPRPTMSELTGREMCAAAQLHAMQELPSLDQIANMEMKEAAEYADPICKKYASDADFATAQAPAGPPFDTGDFVSYNATSVANCAYMALYAGAKREVYAEHLKVLQAWIKKRQQTESKAQCCLQ